ncbi:hypothetical protein HBI55_035740 [Parastagonospora nodorum]|nr:hypothetical protein HBI55_035740 [Parastagonospora nodorum]
MALKTHTIPSPSFVESCGAILFSPTYTHISLLKFFGEWVEVGEACGILEFESDREVVRGAVRVLADTLGCGVGVCVREWKGVCG